jgi:hypothetical protein
MHNSTPCPKINIDTGTAVAFVSEGSTQRHNLKAKVKGKSMVMTQTAHAEFTNIVNTIGGPKEKARAQEFLKKVQVIPDNPSPRAQALRETKIVGANDKIIFGTADNHGIQTLTADGKFVRGAEAQGVRFNADVHDPVPLKGV